LNLKNIREKLDALNLTDEKLQLLNEDEIRKLYKKDTEQILKYKKRINKSKVNKENNKILSLYPKCPKCKAPIEKSSGYFFLN
jgi:hypothetical protein